ncbi:serpin family protein [Sorangium sp. So ce513]|uniref:serpin family protein n=1 Tax=Sorangium sp. So ce513 TaxID=3133315 RepID=UPI003F6447FF
MLLTAIGLSALVGCSSGQGGNAGGGGSGQGGNAGGGGSGQGGGDAVEPPVECFEVKPGCVVPSDATRIENPVVSAEDLQALSRNNASFALDLGRALHGATTNVVYAPFSISTALAMTYAGARTTTEQAMAAAMRFELPQERLHPAFNHVDLQLQRHAENGGFRLHTANAIWSQIHVLPEKPFLNVLSESYGAHMRLADFFGAPKEAEGLINAWVSDRTGGKIPKLLDDDLTVETVAVVVNAIYFRAQWKTAFANAWTQPGTFRRADGSSVTAQMMHGTHQGSYGTGDGWEAVGIPYAGSAVSMFLVLPAEGTVDAFEESLDGAALGAIFDATYEQQVDVTMPKFSFGTSTSLKETLSHLGMAIAFGSKADFTGILADQKLWIHDVIHATRIDVDEAGTEAAGSTGVILGSTATGLSALPAEIVLDRPFFFFIRDASTQTILFAGRVNDPTAR